MPGDDAESDRAPRGASGKKADGGGDGYRGITYGVQILVGVGLGLLIGQWLDNRYGWGPWGTTVGAMLGLSGGLYLLIKDAIRMNK